MKFKSVVTLALRIALRAQMCAHITHLLCCKNENLCIKCTHAHETLNAAAKNRYKQKTEFSTLVEASTGAQKLAIFIYKTHNRSHACHKQTIHHPNSNKTLWGNKLDISSLKWQIFECLTESMGQNFFRLPSCHQPQPSPSRARWKQPARACSAKLYDLNHAQDVWSQRTIWSRSESTAVCWGSVQIRTHSQSVQLSLAAHSLSPADHWHQRWR